MFPFSPLKILTFVVSLSVAPQVLAAPAAYLTYERTFMGTKEKVVIDGKVLEPNVIKSNDLVEAFKGNDRAQEFARDYGRQGVRGFVGVVAALGLVVTALTVDMNDGLKTATYVAATAASIYAGKQSALAEASLHDAVNTYNGVAEKAAAAPNKRVVLRLAYDF